MPSFNAYPAAQVETVDIPGVLANAQELRNARTKNRLLEMKLQNEAQAGQRQRQFGKLVPGLMEGDQDTLGQAAALDPEMTAKYLDVFSKMDERKRSRVKEELERVGNVALAIETAPPVQRPDLYQQIKQQMQAAGQDTSQWPQTYDPAWVRRKIAEAGEIKTLLDQAEQSAPETHGGMQFNEETDQWEPIEGYVPAGGEWTVSRDPFGNEFLINKVTGEVRQLGGGQGTAPRTQAGAESGAEEPETTEGLGYDPAQATGISGFLAPPAGWVMETFFGADVVPEARKGQIALDTLRRNAVTIGSTDVPGRPTDFARQLEDALTIKAGNIFETDINARRKLETALDRVTAEVNRMSTVLDRRDITPKQRSNIVQNQTHMQRLQQELATLLEAWGGNPSVEGLEAGEEIEIEGVPVRRVR